MLGYIICISVQKDGFIVPIHGSLLSPKVRNSLPSYKTTKKRWLETFIQEGVVNPPPRSPNQSPRHSIPSPVREQPSPIKEPASSPSLANLSNVSRFVADKFYRLIDIFRMWSNHVTMGGSVKPPPRRSAKSFKSSNVRMSWTLNISCNYKSMI